MAPLNVCLVGHRGTGKTSFLARVNTRGGDRALYDLDEEISRASGLTISEIFEREGEAAFRAREREQLRELLQRPGPKVIAVGAGYEGERPENAYVLWLRRTTDAAGRSFLNRPRLQSSQSPWREYLDRFDAREARYRAWADQVLLLPEGYDGGLEDVIDGEWFMPFDLTLDARAMERWSTFWGRRQGWGLRRLEIRDDLLDPSRVPVRGLRSYRRPGATLETEPREEDWALELGVPPRAFDIVSIHEGTIHPAISRLAAYGAAIQKLAVDVGSFEELLEGHRWWLAHPERRAFLPRSASGRWRWYRSLFGPMMPLHFIREDQGSAADQPPLWQVRLQTPFQRQFAAVLGSPVEHSRTPMEHREYFARARVPVVAIDVAEEEWDEALPVLRELGLAFAAVTAPLKQNAFASCRDRTAEAERTGSVNTLSFENDGLHGANTDILALHRLRAELGDHAKVWIWGGGGVKSSVLEAWPHARAISARAGVEDFETESPDLVIWAVGRAREFRWPPSTVTPKLVLDLNYADDSPGLEWAVARGLPYQSGLTMFKLQAEAQREFWNARRELGARQFDRQRFLSDHVR